MRMKTTAAKPVEVAAAETQALVIAQKLDVDRYELIISAIEVADDRQLAAANEVLHELRAWREEWTEYWAPLKSKARAVHLMIVAMEKDKLVPADRLIGLVKDAMRPYVLAQERAALEERRAVEQEAEALRQQKEAESKKLALQGRMAEATLAQQHADAIMTPIIPANPVKLQSTGLRHDWEIEVTNLMALVKAVAAGHVPLEALAANEAWLRSQARQIQPDDGQLYPGVKAKQTVGFAVRQ